MFSRKYPVHIRIYYRGSPRYTFISTENDIFDHEIAKCVFCVSNKNYEKRMQSSEKSVEKYLTRICLSLFTPQNVYLLNSSKI